MDPDGLKIGVAYIKPAKPMNIIRPMSIGNLK